MTRSPNTAAAIEEAIRAARDAGRGEIVERLEAIAAKLRMPEEGEAYGSRHR